MNSKAKVPAGTPVGNYGDRRFGFTWNDDVLMEILLLIPAKSVTRFKLVCKHWLSLISSAEFCHHHTLRRLKQRPSLILKMPDSQFFQFDPVMNGEKLTMPYSFSVSNPRIISSCNGLMLLRTHYTEQSFYVYNPTTTLSRKVSVPDTHSNNNPRIVALALAFDPSESPHYKVVCIRTTTEDDSEIHTYQIEVYDSESRTWKLRLGPFTFPRVLFISSLGVYWNGSIYWEILHEIGYYDIAKNEFKPFSDPNYPPIPSQGNYIISTVTSCLEVADGHLYRSRLVTKGDCQSITLFELDTNDRSSWLLKYHGIISEHEPTSSFFSYAHNLRFIKGSYDKETCSVVSHMSGKISVYSFLDKSYKLLIDLTGEPFYYKDARDSNLEIYEFGECFSSGLSDVIQLKLG